MMEKLKCKDPECIELHETEWEDIELILNVEEAQTTQYKIGEDGILKVIDSDCTAQELWLICPCCDTRYEFKQEYVEVEKCAKLTFDIDDNNNFKINRIKKAWED
ncbi:hypothetical protein [Paenibacillus chitinolyticus]|nr:hypothetical protein [Paenibacillus chitinolyticus]